MAKAPLTPDDPRHGTLNGYNNLKCRCERCRSVAVESNMALRAQRVAAPFDQKPHGTKSGYQNWGCRCAACTEAVGFDPTKRERAAKRRAEFVALADAGLTASEISRELGSSRQAAQSMADRYGITLAKREPPEPTDAFKMLAAYQDKPELRAVRNELVRAVYDEGFSLRAIGEQIGVTHQMVSLIVNAMPRPRCESCGHVLPRGAS